MNCFGLCYCRLIRWRKEKGMPNVVSLLVLFFLAVMVGGGVSLFLYDHYHNWWSVIPVIILPVLTLIWWCWLCRHNSVAVGPEDEQFRDSKEFLRETSAGTPSIKSGRDQMVCAICRKPLDFSSGEEQRCCGQTYTVRYLAGGLRMVQADNATHEYAPVGQDC